MWVAQSFITSDSKGRFFGIKDGCHIEVYLRPRHVRCSLTIVPTSLHPLQEQSIYSDGEFIKMTTQYSGNGSSLPDEFDIIVAGGGSCGCVVAGR